jgi:hypothetical protein
MTQVHVRNPEIIEKLKNDAAFRKEFLANTKKMMDGVGYHVDQKTLEGALEHQLKGHGRAGAQAAAGTNILINIF